MPLTKPSQELFEDLEGHAAILDCTANDISEIAKRVNERGMAVDARELLELCKTLREQYETIIDIVDSIEDGLIVRKKS